MKRFLLPLGLFLVLLVFLAVGLGLNPREVPSPLLGKPAPAFSAPRLENAGAVVTAQQMRGQVWVLNVWASWCASCQVEHPVLLAFARRGMAPVVGLNYKDVRADGMAWLHKHGNPYVTSVYDHDGRIGIDWGVYGVPETFVIDRRGVVRFKHVGPLTPQVVAERLVPKIEELTRDTVL